MNPIDFNTWERDLDELYRVAADLIAGAGGPDEYRKPGGDPRLLMPAFGRTELTVGVWEDVAYGPLTAMVVAAFILHGKYMEGRLAQMGIVGDLADAYAQLQQHFGPRASQPRLPSTARHTASTSLAAALEAPKREDAIRLTLRKQPTATIAAKPTDRPALPHHADRPAIPDLGGQ